MGDIGTCMIWILVEGLFDISNLGRRGICNRSNGGRSHTCNYGLTNGEGRSSDNMNGEDCWRSQKMGECT